MSASLLDNHNNKTPNRAPNKSLLLAEIILPAESPAAVSDCAVKMETTLYVSDLDLWHKLQRNRSAKDVEWLEEHRRPAENCHGLGDGAKKK